MDRDFAELLEKLHAVEAYAERMGFNRAADFLHESRAILREHDPAGDGGYYQRKGPCNYVEAVTPSTQH